MSEPRDAVYFSYRDAVSSFVPVPDAVPGFPGHRWAQTILRIGEPWRIEGMKPTPDESSQTLLSAPVRSHATLAWDHFYESWVAVPSRFRCAVEAERRFRTTVPDATNVEASVDFSFRLDNEYFSFFTCTAAAIESFAYSAFAVGAMLSPSSFPMSTPQQRRRISLDAAAAGFRRSWPHSPLAAELRGLLADDDYRGIRDLRNRLAHRSSPTSGSVVMTSSNRSIDIWVMGDHTDEANRVEFMSASTLEWRLEWLRSTVARLIAAASEFAINEFDPALVRGGAAHGRRIRLQIDTDEETFERMTKRLT